jgi:hypothetical protein
VSKFFKALAKLASSSVLSLAKSENNWPKNIERVSEKVKTTRQFVLFQIKSISLPIVVSDVRKKKQQQQHAKYLPVSLPMPYVFIF